MSIISDISTISSSLNAIKEAIIDKGVTPLGDITTYAEAIRQIRGDESESGVEPVEVTKYGCSIDNLLGNVDANGVLQMPSDTSGNIVFTGVEDIGNQALYYKYYGNSNLTHGVSFPDLEIISGSNGAYSAFSVTGISSASFPKLKTISGTNGCRYLCYLCSSLTSVSLPELTTISGSYGGASMFQSCSSLTSVSLPKLKTISGSYSLSSFVGGTSIQSFSLPELEELSGSNSMQQVCGSCSVLENVYFTKLSIVSGSSVFPSAFQSCPKIKDIYFNALTTTSFGSYVNQFQNMFNSTTGSTATGGCTVHFPSNLQSTISGLTGYPLFGGTSGYVVLAFDLPATS